MMITMMPATITAPTKSKAAMSAASIATAANKPGSMVIRSSLIFRLRHASTYSAPTARTRQPSRPSKISWPSMARMMSPGSMGADPGRADEGADVRDEDSGRRRDATAREQADGGGENHNGDPDGEPSPQGDRPVEELLLGDVRVVVGDEGEAVEADVESRHDGEGPPPADIRLPRPLRRDSGLSRGTRMSPGTSCFIVPLQSPGQRDAIFARMGGRDGGRLGMLTRARSGCALLARRPRPRDNSLSKPAPRRTPRARRALREARTEAVVVPAIDVALLAGLASIDKAKGWDIIDLSWWAWRLVASPALLMMILLLAVPLAELSPGRVRKSRRLFARPPGRLRCVRRRGAARRPREQQLGEPQRRRTAGPRGGHLAHQRHHLRATVLAARRGRTARPRRARAA